MPAVARPIASPANERPAPAHAHGSFRERIGVAFASVDLLAAPWLAVADETCSYLPAMTRMVKCVKLGETLPALPYKPFQDALGQRIYDSVSAEAWRQWIEHSKKIVNEYRLDLTQKKAHEVLKEQCEAFLFGDGGQLPPEYVPEKH
jgi:Fe-S cluster biosynthesis and repair protein YggX